MTSGTREAFRLRVYFSGRKPPARGVVRIPPDLAIEVISPFPRDEQRDRVEKMGEYADFKIGFYWLVDPTRRSVEILELSGTAYTRRLEASSSVIDPVPGCAGLRLDIDAMWAKIDALERE